MNEVLPLEGIYLHLVRNGVPISVRDYQDALSAVAAGHGGVHRDRLQWLCETLWCRSDHDAVLLHQLFRSFPHPDPDVVRNLAGDAFSEAEADAGSRTSSQPEAVRAPAPERTTVEFLPRGRAGTAVPRARRAFASERFILAPRPVVGLRALIVTWRRFRRAQRSGPRVELDIDATVAEQTRRGRLAAPVWVPARRNLARLAVLVDVSPSMAPWRRWNATLAESLRASRLAHTSMRFFDNVPNDVVFERESLTHATPLANLWRREPGGALLIVSDAGAARGAIVRERIAATRAFLRAVQVHWSPIAWMNPMPRSRWAATSAAHAARSPGCRMFELTEDGFVSAVDFLRGKSGG
jgi:uncharacterized protein with von Willebrand factor type A (vWA) domain